MHADVSKGVPLVHQVLHAARDVKLPHAFLFLAFLGGEDVNAPSLAYADRTTGSDLLRRHGVEGFEE
jgi:hypothetical protein